MTTWRLIFTAATVLNLLNLIQIVTVQKVAENVECQDLFDCALLGYMSSICINARCVENAGYLKKSSYRLDGVVKRRSGANLANERPIGDSLRRRETAASRAGGGALKSCKETSDCELDGYTCQHGQCICEVERRLIESVQYGKRDRFFDVLKGIMADSSYSKCHETVSPEMVLWGLAGGLQYREMSQGNGSPKAKTYGDRCKGDYECLASDVDLVCKKTEPRRCRCKRGLVWDSIGVRCFMGDDHPPYDGYLDPVRQMILPGVILITLGAMIYLGFKLFCNCGRRGIRRTPDMESSHLVPNPATWVASYRVLSPVNGTEGRSNQPLQPSLLVPDGPPTYEEALTHKIIFSSYNPTTNQAQPL